MRGAMIDRRVELGLTKTAIAAELGISICTLTKIEKGLANIKPEKWGILGEFMGLDPETLKQKVPRKTKDVKRKKFCTAKLRTAFEKIGVSFSESARKLGWTQSRVQCILSTGYLKDYEIIPLCEYLGVKEKHLEIIEPEKTILKELLKVEVKLPDLREKFKEGQKVKAVMKNDKGVIQGHKKGVILKKYPKFALVQFKNYKECFSYFELILLDKQL